MFVLLSYCTKDNEIIIEGVCFIADLARRFFHVSIIIVLLFFRFYI